MVTHSLLQAPRPSSSPPTPHCCLCHFPKTLLGILLLSLRSPMRKRQKSSGWHLSTDWTSHSPGLLWPLIPFPSFNTLCCALLSASTLLPTPTPPCLPGKQLQESVPVSLPPGGPPEHLCPWAGTDYSLLCAFITTASINTPYNLPMLSSSSLKSKGLVSLHLSLKFR